MRTPTTNGPGPTRRRVDCLDGLRGIAALWVLIGHAMLLTGWHVPILGAPDLGVELFILLSGFLMVFQYELREAREPWASAGTWLRFWTRRFFRIAPLYYVALAAALLLGPAVFEARQAIDAFLVAYPQAASRYVDTSVSNIIAHLSFLFGLSPRYAFRTALPDWSLGLEMQFYAVFPFLMLLLRRLGWPLGVLLIAGAAAAVAFALRARGVTFPMPSFLPLKLHVFLAGMLLAAALGRGRRTGVGYLLLAMALMAVPIGGGQSFGKVAVREILIVIFAALVHHEELPGRAGAAIQRISITLGNRFFSWLGELSFGVYLVHLLILQPVVAALIAAFGHDIGAAARFAMAAAITVPASYTIAWAANRLIELPGQRLGRRVLSNR